MIALKDMQFELLASEESAEDGVGFGFGLPVAVNADGFDSGELSFLTQDAVNPVTGTMLAGRDVPAARTWTWAAHVNTDDDKEALAALGVFTAAWRAGQVIRTPGLMVPLRYRVGGRIRRVYGRPRRLAAPPDNRILGGYIPVTAQFGIVDDLHYADVQDSAELGFSSDSDGGFILPSVFPITTLPQSDRTGAINVLGDVDTYPIIRFEGPISKPYLVGPGWTVSLDVDLANGEWATIDTRPWKLTVLKNGSAGVGGRLGKRQYLTDVRLPPGNHSLRFGGASTSALARCTVSWRSAYSSL